MIKDFSRGGVRTNSGSASQQLTIMEQYDGWLECQGLVQGSAGKIKNEVRMIRMDVNA